MPGGSSRANRTTFPPNGGVRFRPVEAPLRRAGSLAALTTRRGDLESIRLRDGRALGFADWGSPDGFPVFYLHGAMGSPLRRSASTDAALDTLGIRYLMVHRPGFGLSDPKPGRTLLDWPDDLDELADALGLGRFAVLGVSAGGPYAAACAFRLADRVSASAIVSGLGPLDGQTAIGGLPAGRRWALKAIHGAPGPTSALLGVLVRELRREPRRLVDMLEARNGDADHDELAREEAREIAVESFLEATRNGVGCMIDDFRIASGPWGFRPEDIGGEVHVWHGTRDKTVPIDHALQLAIALPNCRAAFHPDEGHFFFRKRMVEILAALTAARGEPAPRTPTLA